MEEGRGVQKQGKYEVKLEFPEGRGWVWNGVQIKHLPAGRSMDIFWNENIRKLCRNCFVRVTVKCLSQISNNIFIMSNEDKT